MKSRSLRILLLLAALLAPAAARAQADLLLDRPVSEGVEHPPTSVATDQGPASGGVNPAGLATGASGLSYLHEDQESTLPYARRGDGVFASLGGLVAGDTGALALGLSMEWVRPRTGCSAATPCARRTSLALAAGTSAVALGGAFRWFSSDESRAIDRLGTLDLGLTLRPAAWLSVAATGLALNAPQDVSREGVLGLALRPLSSERLTVAADYRFDGKDGFSRGFLRYYASVRLHGLDLVAQLSHPVQAPAGSRDVALVVALQAGFGNVSVTAGGGGLLAGPPGAAVNVGAEVLTARGPYVFGAPKVAQTLRLQEALGGPSPLAQLLGAAPGLDAYTRLALRLERLADDDSLDTLVLEIRGTGDLTLGRVEELRGLLQGLRARGKHVVAWLEGGGDTAYYLACAAEKIYAAPQGLLEVNGLSTQRIYLRGTLRKLGVEPEFVKIGDYKSAPEQFMNEEPSVPAALETDALLDDQFGRYVAAVAKARGLDAPRVRALLDRGLMVTEDAVAAGLLDGVTAAGTALDELVAKVAGRPLPRESLGPEPQAPVRWGAVPGIGLIEVKGDIVPGDGQAMAAADRIVRQLRRAAADPSLRALVVRVESPGGDVGASELIWQAVHEAAKKKPVVASFGDVAASGGYYVGCAAGTIVAEPSTITGSIGVFAGKADLSGLLGKLGVTTRTFRRGDKADILTLTRPWTEAERLVMEGVVRKFYETFLQRVAEGRKMSTGDVDQVAQGRVWTGAQAKERRLVDVLGGLEVALQLARDQAGLPAGAPVAVEGASGLFELPAAVRTLPPQAPGALAGLTPLQALELLARGVAEPTALQTLSERARPLVEALASGRPLAYAVDLPQAR